MSNTLKSCVTNALWILILATSAAYSQDSFNVVSYTKMYADANGVTHFSDEEIPFGTPSEVGGRVTLWSEATLMSFVTLPAGFDQDWHPAPRLQWSIILSGTIEIEVQDGEVRRFTSGDVFTNEDTSGKGHKTRVIGNEPALGAWIQFDHQ